MWPFSGISSAGYRSRVINTQDGTFRPEAVPCNINLSQPPVKNNNATLMNDGLSKHRKERSQYCTTEPLCKVNPIMCVKISKPTLYPHMLFLYAYSM